MRTWGVYFADRLLERYQYR
uniref:Uncharacterized protein n=1 Tax=Anguilla anguilla TaxID=7936 RepID=A0A0E9PEI2_ANGAN